MTKSKSCIIVSLLVALIIIFILNFYFVSYLNDGQNGAGRDGTSLHKLHSKASLLSQVRKKVKQLKPVYVNRNPRYYSIRNKVWRNFDPKPYDNVSTIWDIAYWVNIINLFSHKIELNSINAPLFLQFFSGQTTMKFIRPSIQRWANCCTQCNVNQLSMLGIRQKAHN